MGSSDTGKKLIIVGLFLFFIPFFAIPIMMFGAISSGGFPSFAFIPIVFILAAAGMVLMIVGGIMSGGASPFRFPYHRQTIPPVQYPSETRITRNRDAVEEITCPNCGASPKYIDHYGLCLCEYCETKYKVR